MQQMKFFSRLLLFLLSLFTVVGCDNSSSSTSPTDIISDAYIFSLPLVMVAATMQYATNTVEASSKKAPLNQLHHATDLAKAGFQGVVSPNVDTLYSQAFIDLKDGPLVFVKPESDRYCSMQFMDGWTNSVGIAGSGGGGGNTYAEQVCILINEDDHDTVVPPGMTEIRFSGNLGWIIGRTLCEDEDDLVNVWNIQDQMQLLPLSAYLDGGSYVPPAGTYDPEYDYVPVERVTSMSPVEFFEEANRLMQENTPVAADQPMMDKLRSIGVGPGLTFDPGVLGKDADAIDKAWKDMLKRVDERIKESSRMFFVYWNSWEFLGEPISEFGTEYDYRAMVALAGLGANPVSAAIYASANRDSDGSPLKAGGYYKVHFEAGALPPTLEDGFWSITVYGDDNFLIPNSIDRYSINDRTPLTFNEDGSLDLFIQPEALKDNDPLKANWLPIGDDGFHLLLRIYCPDMEIIDAGWQAPGIVHD